MRKLMPAGALVLLCAVTPALATPALAATAAKAAGSATSSVGLLSIAAGGHTFDVATLALLSDTIAAAPVAKVVVTPLVVDGTAYGQQTITPASGATTVPALPTSGLTGIPGVVEVVSPAITASAETPTTGPKASAGAQSLGSLTVLGLPVSLAGTAQVVTGVTSGAATATKQLAVSNLALPSIADLLAGLGLDLSKVPLDTLLALVDQLDLVVTGAFTTAMAAVDGVQAQITTATATLASVTAQLAAATAAVDSALAALNTALAGTGLTAAAFAALAPAAQALLPVPLAAYNTYLTTLSTQNALQGAVALAQAAIDALQATLATALAALFDAVRAILDGTPLLSLENLEISTSAVATSASAGGQTATIAGGQITGLKVLGTDVLDTVLGVNSINVLDLTGSVLGEVTAVADGLTGTLASVLSDVAGLELTAPTIDVFGKTTRTGVVNGFGEAETAVSALSVTLPRITLPSALSLPGVGTLPAFEGVTAVNGVLASLAGSVDLLTLRELSRFRPAVVAAPPAAPPTPNAPTLPSTGGNPAGGLAGMVLLLAAGALVLVRRRTSV